MLLSFEDPTVALEHDHTQLDVVFEDLRAIARQALTTSDSVLLEDARTQWTFLQEEIARHFGKEERKIFAVLAAQLPDLEPRFAELSVQHQTLRRELTQLGQLLRGSIEEVITHRAGFEAGWQAFEALWRKHSDIEFELLQVVAQRQSGLAGPATEGSVV